MSDLSTQLDLFSAVTDTYLNASDVVSNKEAYTAVARKLNMDEERVNEQTKVGASGDKHKLFYRKVRWIQQSLKQQKILERVGDGLWRMIGTKKVELRAIKEGKSVLAMSTKLGVCLWTKSESVFADLIDEPIHLILTSPPYPIKVSRAYGNPALSEYIEFICTSLEPVVDKLVRGGSIALNVSNDIFEDKSPARSTYLERLIIALEDRLGLKKMDTMAWISNKAPGPIQWASLKRIQLNTGYEPILWLSNSPLDAFSNNQRVLMPHSESHKRFMESGGQKTAAVNADGNYVKRVGSYGNVTQGKIPKNVLNLSNYCHSGRMVSQYAKQLGIPPHSAKMPFSVADFLVRFLTEPGQLVVDPFAGTLTTGEAAERNGRSWLCCELTWEYIRQSFVRFDDVWVNPAFANAFHVKA